MISKFLMSGDKRLVELRGQSPRAEEEKELTPQNLSKIVPELSARSRSRSPPKRQREEDEEDEDSRDVTVSKRPCPELDDQDIKEVQISVNLARIEEPNLEEILAKIGDEGVSSIKRTVLAD
jgi:hypothetical protein